MSRRIFIDGAAGTTGLEIAGRLADRSEFDLITLSDAERKNDTARARAINAADFVILCLPDDAARQSITMIENASTRVIDASTAHRTDPDWAYGFPEFAHGQREKIAAARFVSNPGCYPTGFLALVAPLVENGLLPACHGYTLNAVSGYSGGGKALIARFEEDRGIAFRSYALSLTHKHQAEMQAHAGLEHAPLFAPAVIPAFRGMLVEVPLMLGTIDGAAPANEIADALASHYSGEKLVNVTIDYAETEMVLRTDFPPTDTMELFVLSDKQGSAMRLVARLDNLGKGASGAAVQNLNLMAGIDETAGLRL